MVAQLGKLQELEVEVWLHTHVVKLVEMVLYQVMEVQEEVIGHCKLWVEDLQQGLLVVVMVVVEIGFHVMEVMVEGEGLHVLEEVVVVVVVDGLPLLDLVVVRVAMQLLV